ncbi:hypothetical protein DMENIID0001_111890 [Sergentomyia squamirostris]
MKLFEDVKSRIRVVEDDLSTLHDENIQLKERITVLEKGKEQDRRRPEDGPRDPNAIEIHGLPILKMDDLYREAETMFNDTLEMKLTARDLDHVFFIDKARVSVNDAAEREESENPEDTRTRSMNTVMLDRALDQI